MQEHGGEESAIEGRTLPCGRAENDDRITGQVRIVSRDYGSAPFSISLSHTNSPRRTNCHQHETKQSLPPEPCNHCGGGYI